MFVIILVVLITNEKLLMLPGPTTVPTVVLREMSKPIIGHRSKENSILIASTKEKAKKVFQTKKDMLIITSSSTGGVESSITNVVKKGDNVVVTDFGEFGSRVANQVESSGGNVIRIKAPLGEVPSLDITKQAFEGTEEIKAVYVVHNETSTGVAFRWLSELGKLAKDKGAFYIIDAVSSLGGDELNVDDLGVDICVTGSQKCLAAPPGLSLMSLSEQVKDYMIANPIKHHYFNIPRYLKYSTTDETPFTPAVSLFYALDKALSLILEEGLENRINRHKICAKALYQGFDSLGIERFVKSESRSNTVLTFQYPNQVQDIKFRQQLDEKYDVIIAGCFGKLKGKLFRVGCMGEINRKHVLNTINSVGLLFREFGIPVNLEKAISDSFNELKSL